MIRILLTAFLVAAVTATISAPASAVTCYAKVGSACVKKSYGSYWADCSTPCAVGIARTKGLQQALIARGANPGPVDGVMGPKTREALRAFQKVQNLPPTGRLDEQSREKLGIKE